MSPPVKPQTSSGAAPPDNKTEDLKAETAGVWATVIGLVGGIACFMLFYFIPYFANYFADTPSKIAAAIGAGVIVGAIRFTWISSGLFDDAKPLTWQLRFRAAATRRSAATMMWLIIGVIVVGLGIFVKIGATAGNNALDIPSLIGRGFISVLLFFLVQILLQNYRYLVSLAAFYDARADAVTLQVGDNAICAGLDADTKKDWLKSYFYPENVHFGPIPNSPYAQLLEAASNLSKAAESLKAPKSS